MTERSRRPGWPLRRPRCHAGSLVLAVALLVVGLSACQGCRSSPPAARAPSAGVGPPTLRLYLLTDLAGALEPCGCTKDQLGGLDHFGAWVSHERAQSGPSLVAGAGPLFFMDEQLTPERSDQDKERAETLARVLGTLGFAAFAPGANDWASGAPTLAGLARLAGAVVIAPGPAAPPFESIAIREVGSLRVGFVGYGQPLSPEGPARIEDVVRSGVARAKAAGASVLIALAAVGRGEAKRIADAVPELTAVVVGSPKANGEANTESPQAERVGDVLVVQAANHLQSVAVLDLFVRETVAPGRLIQFADGTGLELASRREELARRIDDLHVKIAAWERDRSVGAADLEARRRDLAGLEAALDALDVKPPPANGSFFRYSLKEIRESLGKDPSIEDQMRAYYKAVNERNRVQFANRLPPAPASDQATYIGVEACTTCHEGPRRVWNSTRHAVAYGTLASQFKEFNLDCVSCHVTGYEKPGGSTVTHVDKLENVQCEVCHGPGSKHAQAPRDPAFVVAKPDLSTCIGCHHPPHVEGFDPAIKLKDILGPGHGLPAR